MIRMYVTKDGKTIGGREVDDDAYKFPLKIKFGKDERYELVINCYKKLLEQTSLFEK